MWPAWWWRERLPASSSKHQRPVVGARGPTRGEWRPGQVEINKSPSSSSMAGPSSSPVWIPDRGEDDRPVRRTAGRMEGTRNGRTCAGCPRTNALDSPPTRAKWGATIRPPTTSPCTRSLAPFPLTLPVCAFPHPRSWEGLPRQRPYSALRRLDIRKRYAAKVRFGPGAATAPPRPCNLGGWRVS